MGQKVNPHGLRVGVIKDWDSRWYAEGRDFADNLVEDYNIRKFLKKRLYSSGISKIEFAAPFSVEIDPLFAFKLWTRVFLSRNWFHTALLVFGKCCSHLFRFFPCRV